MRPGGPTNKASRDEAFTQGKLKSGLRALRSQYLLYESGLPPFLSSVRVSDKSGTIRTVTTALDLFLIWMLSSLSRFDKNVAHCPTFNMSKAQETWLFLFTRKKKWSAASALTIISS